MNIADYAIIISKYPKKHRKFCEPVRRRAGAAQGLYEITKG
jgi:hypothetical protein